MRRTFTLLATTLVMAAGITGSASAATLYTSAAHTTPVAVGTTIPVPGVNWFWWNGAAVIGTCPGPNGYIFKVTQNSGGVVKADVQTAFLANCNGAFVQSSVGKLQISGSSTTVGSNKAWLGTTLTGSFTLNGTITYTESFTGATGSPPANGVYVQQPTAGGAPVSIVLDHAGSISGPSGLTSTTVSASYTLAGSPAAAYSLG
jgi:hypothetical protein